MKRLKKLLVLFTVLLLAGCAPERIVSILSTDLSVNMDPDDWFDTYLFMLSPHLNPEGVILTDYATDEVMALAEELRSIAGKEEIPLLKGVNQALVPGVMPANTDGAEFILNTMRNSRGKVRLIAIGSLRNEALAYWMDPQTFLEKVEEVVFVSVPQKDEFVINVMRDTVATSAVYGSGAKIVAVPAVKQKLTGEMEMKIANTDSDICRFLTARLREWRKHKGSKEPGFLERTNQIYGQGKNLWSLPVFIPEEDRKKYGIELSPCDAYFESGNTTVHELSEDGNDLWMGSWDEKAVLDYALDMILPQTDNAVKPKKVIFDTDMGNDVDDCIALDMLMKYQDEGRVDLRGVVSSKREEGSIRYIDAMMTMYGHADVPIGIAKTYPHEGYVCADKRADFATYVTTTYEFPSTVSDYDAVDDGYELLRRLLADNEGSKDITIVAVGFSTNLSRLLESEGDEFSPLSGKELIERNVEKLVMMAGNFKEKVREYNVYKDREAAAKVCEEWPSPVFFSGFEIGSELLYPYSSIETGYQYAGIHPVVEAFKYYDKVPYDRPMWDPATVLFAVEGADEYCTLSKSGKVEVDQSSITHFTEDEGADRRYYIVDEHQNKAIMDRIIELTGRTPVCMM